MTLKGIIGALPGNDRAAFFDETDADAGLYRPDKRLWKMRGRRGDLNKPRPLIELLTQSSQKQTTVIKVISYQLLVMLSTSTRGVQTLAKHIVPLSTTEVNME